MTGVGSETKQLRGQRSHGQNKASAGALASGEPSPGAAPRRNDTLCACWRHPDGWGSLPRGSIPLRKRGKQARPQQGVPACSPLWSQSCPQGGPGAGGTFRSAQGLQQNVVLSNLLSVVLELPPELVQLFPGELPRGLCLRGERPSEPAAGRAHLSTPLAPPPPRGPQGEVGNGGPRLSLGAIGSTFPTSPPPSHFTPETEDIWLVSEFQLLTPRNVALTEHPGQEPVDGSAAPATACAVRPWGWAPLRATGPCSPHAPRSWSAAPLLCA